MDSSGSSRPGRLKNTGKRILKIEVGKLKMIWREMKRRRKIAWCDGILSRDVTKFELEFDSISTDLKFVECLEHFVVECEFMEKSLFYE